MQTELAPLCVDVMRRPQDYPKGSLLMYASEMIVRAYGASYNGQPKAPVFNDGKGDWMMYRDKYNRLVSRDIETLENLDPQYLGENSTQGAGERAWCSE